MLPVPTTMAKKKRSPVKAKAQAPHDSDLARKPMVLQVRGSEEYKEWAEGLAKFDDRALSSLVERALRLYAKQIGYKPDPPQR